VLVVDLVDPGVVADVAQQGYFVDSSFHTHKLKVSK
jgi:hypothetical protein